MVQSSNPISVSPQISTGGIQNNWINTVNLPTYNFSFYLASDDIYNNPDLLKNDQPILASNRAYLIAQSGATAGFGIDNVAFTTTALGGSTDTAQTTLSSVQFELHEVLGFELYEAMYRYIVAYGYRTLRNSKYVLKLEFKGRDPATDRPVKYPGVFFFQLQIQDISASIGAGGTSYMIQANCQSRESLDISRSPTAVTATEIITVKDYLTAIGNKLNENERIIRRENEGTAVHTVHKQWNIVWDGSMSPIINSEMRGVQPGDSSVANQDEIGGIQISIPANTNLVPYLYEELNRDIPSLVTMREEATWEEGLPKIVVNSNVEVDAGQLDTQTNQIVQKITITVSLARTFDRPTAEPTQEEANRGSLRIQNSFLNNLSPYIYRRYDFLYTGENTEVIDVDLNINAMFFDSIPPSFNTHSLDGGQFMPLVETIEQQTPKGGLPSGPSALQPGVTAPVRDIDNTSPAENNNISPDGSSSANQQLEMISSSQNAFMNLELNIVGDPWWIGVSDAFPTSDALRNSAAQRNRIGDQMIAFINYFPSQNVARVDNQARGRFDYLTSGVYTVQNVSHRFQAGKFTQSLKCLKRDDLTASLVKGRLERL